MQMYLEPIKVGFLVFPFIALVMTLPYLIFEYHKYGAIPPMRSMIIYTFVLYLLIAYFLVILPLPSKSAVAMMPTKIPQLIPFKFVVDIINNTSIIWNDIHSYLTFLKSPAVYTILFNLLLTLPLGIYLRYYFQKKWYQILLLTFCVSLFFEITQLTGLYGIYPKAYRLFDVDDLLINTLGGMIGMWITPLITKLLPSRKRLDEISYQKGQNVSIYRRIVAFLIDIFCFNILLFFCSIFLHIRLEILWLLLTIIYYLVLPLMTRGKTIGKYIVRIRLISQKEDKASLLIFLRQLLLYLIILPTPYLVILLWNNHTNIMIISFVCTFISFLLVFYYCRFWIQLIKALLGSKKPFYYEKVTKTKNISTITFENNSRQEE